MLEVGEYARTSKGEITRIIGLDDFIEDDGTTFYETTDNPGYMDLCSKDIVKHSKNIIDLIEEDDWINGQHVKEVKDGYAMVGNGIDGFMIWGRNIQRIVTKEQFKNIEYKVNT